MALYRIVLALLITLPSTFANATPEQDHFCQGVGLMSGNLQQHLQQGQTQEAAVNSVLDETEAPASERDGIRTFLNTLAELVKTLPLNASATQAFVQLSCGPGQLFGDETARANYQKDFPRYLAGANACNQKSTSLDDLHTCMNAVFNPDPTATQTP